MRVALAPQGGMSLALIPVILAHCSALHCGARVAASVASLSTLSWPVSPSAPRCEAPPRKAVLVTSPRTAVALVSMAAPRRRGGSLHSEGEEQALRQLVTRLLDQDPVDLVRLREVAATHGLLDARLRSKAWPKLLGVNSYDPAVSPAALAAAAQLGHPDAGTVTVDVQRCSWLPREGLAGAELATARATLEALLNGAVCLANTRAQATFPGGEVHYFQGLHDVAAVLWLNCGTVRAGACLVGLLTGHLRDCAGSDLAPVIAQLALLRPLLHRADPEQAAFLARAARKSGVLPPPPPAGTTPAPASSGDASSVPYFNTDFALSWCLTWFAHSAPDMDTVARLFDLCVASSPLMPLYIGAAACVAGREQLLRGPCDAAEAHRLLTALPAVSRTKAEGGAGASALVRAARTLALKLPPRALGSGLPATSAGHADADWPYHSSAWRGTADISAQPPVVHPDRVLKALARAAAGGGAADAMGQLSLGSGGGGGEPAAAAPGAGAWGEATTPHGAMYAGQMLPSGGRHGLGMLSQPEGNETYTGLWAQDMRHGVGVNVWSDGASYAGDWAADHLHGFGVFTWPSGRCFAGEFRNDKRHGWGVAYASARAAAEGLGTGARFINGAEAEREGTVGVEGDGADSARKARQAASEAVAAAERLRQELKNRGLAVPPPPPAAPSAPGDGGDEGPKGGLKQRKAKGDRALVAF